MYMDVVHQGKKRDHDGSKVITQELEFHMHVGAISGSLTGF